jgi:hypothetical protein
MKLMTMLMTMMMKLTVTMMMMTMTMTTMPMMMKLMLMMTTMLLLIMTLVMTMRLKLVMMTMPPMVMLLLLVMMMLLPLMPMLLMAVLKTHLPSGSPEVCLLSNDVDCRRKAAEMGIEAFGVQEFARSRASDAPELQDLVAAGSEAEAERDASGEKSGKRKRVYVDHMLSSEIAAGIKAGVLHQGALRTSRFNPYEGRIASDAVGQDILISGRIDMNRAMEGDAPTDLFVAQRIASLGGLGGGGSGGEAQKAVEAVG